MTRIKLFVFMLLCCGFILYFLPIGASEYHVVDATTAETFEVCAPDDFETVIEIQSIGVFGKF